MWSYFLRRLMLIVPTLFLVTVVVFLLVRFVPGSALDQMVLENSQYSEFGKDLNVDILKKQLGLDQPIYVQYGRWAGFLPQEDGKFRGVLEFSLGDSLWMNKSVNTIIAERLPVTVELGIMAIIIALLFAFPIGIYSAIRQETFVDYAGRSVAILMLSVPNFWLATMVFVYPSIWWGWTPSVKLIPFLQNPTGNIGMFIVPAFLMGASMSGGLMRMIRTMMLEVMRQDYIRTAYSKGLKESTVIIRHALRNASIPIVTMMGPMIMLLISGAVIMEQIFCLPGMGQLMITALNRRDYPIISGFNLLTGTVIMFVILIVDISYAWLDPRIRYS
jgi:peptide/nickel transport system permease protein